MSFVFVLQHMAMMDIPQPLNRGKRHICWYIEGHEHTRDRAEVYAHCIFRVVDVGPVKKLARPMT
jgi:hypothetical protein